MAHVEEELLFQSLVPDITISMMPTATEAVITPDTEMLPMEQDPPVSVEESASMSMLARKTTHRSMTLPEDVVQVDFPMVDTEDSTVKLATEDSNVESEDVVHSDSEDHGR